MNHLEPHAGKLRNERPMSLRLHRASRGRVTSGRRPGSASSAAHLVAQHWIDDAVEQLSSMMYTYSLDVARDESSVAMLLAGMHDEPLMPARVLPEQIFGPPLPHIDAFATGQEIWRQNGVWVVSVSDIKGYGRLLGSSASREDQSPSSAPQTDTGGVTQQHERIVRVSPSHAADPRRRLVRVIGSDPPDIAKAIDDLVAHERFADEEIARATEDIEAAETFVEENDARYQLVSSQATVNSSFLMLLGIGAGLLKYGTVAAIAGTLAAVVGGVSAVPTLIWYRKRVKIQRLLNGASKQCQKWREFRQDLAAARLRLELGK